MAVTSAKATDRKFEIISNRSLSDMKMCRCSYVLQYTSSLVQKHAEVSFFRELAGSSQVVMIFVGSEI